VDLNELVPTIKTRADFVRFVRALAENLDSAPDEWENPTLLTYLEALAAWTEDMDGYQHNRGEVMVESIDWQTVANIFLAAKIYERRSDRSPLVATLQLFTLPASATAPQPPPPSRMPSPPPALRSRE
jgi:hypothetical protein